MTEKVKETELPMPAADILGLEELENQLAAASAAQEVPDPTGQDEIPAEVGPTPEIIDGWKKAHGKIFGTIIGGMYFVFRGIKRIEYQTILNKVGQNPTFDGEQSIVDTCILWPDEDNAPDLTGKEGIIPSLAGTIVSASGFDPNPEIYEL